MIDKNMVAGLLHITLYTCITENCDLYWG